MLLDVRDTERIWCRGRVLKVVSYADSPQVLLIHYEVRVGAIRAF